MIFLAQLHKKHDVCSFYIILMWVFTFPESFIPFYKYVNLKDKTVSLP